MVLKPSHSPDDSAPLVGQMDGSCPQLKLYPLPTQYLDMWWELDNPCIPSLGGRMGFFSWATRDTCLRVSSCWRCLESRAQDWKGLQGSHRWET